ncbi:MAG: hypothetical protein F6K39_40935 [Okeania sp. SIO3B3]|nr:hypothetical protein [Okeania sp. SIO3B3]
MAAPSEQYFAELTDLARHHLSQVSPVTLDVNPERAMWAIQGRLDDYDIHLKEIFTMVGRTYAYYVVQDGQVVVGFDNYPDRRALRLKYGADFTAHLSERIPHKHGPRKATLDLSGEMTVVQFFDYLNKALAIGTQ